MDQSGTELAVGTSLLRVDSKKKVFGQARYTQDLVLDGMLEAKVLRSPHAHAEIVSIDASRARAMPGVHAVLTREDLDGIEKTYGWFIKDQPIVALDRVRYVGDVVAAVAAVDERTAIAALEAVDVVYRPLDSVFGIDESLEPGAVRLFPDATPGEVPRYGAGARGAKDPEPNICYRFAYEHGDSSVFDECDHVFEDTFTYSRSQHFHLEPFVSVARWSEELLEVWSSTQNPFPVRKELARLFRHPEHLIRVNVGLVGGGFGAKHMCRTEPIAALLSRAASRPVRFCLTQSEGFLTQCQHSARITLRTGVMNDGTFVARHCRVWLESGAYSDASPLVSEKAGYRAPGPYRWKHVDTQADCVMTNTPPAGPFRGFGAPQATWASESQIDMIASRLGLDPIALREANLLRLGDRYAPGESPLDTDIHQGIDIIKDEFSGRGDLPAGRGFGLSVGFKDAGGVNKPAQARVKVMTSGRILLQCGAIELGQGIQTAITQIAAEVLDVPTEWIRYADVNTDAVPFDQGTNASSGVTVMGNAVRMACEDVLRQIHEVIAHELEIPVGDVVINRWVVEHEGRSIPVPEILAGIYGGTGIEFVGSGYTKAVNDMAAPLETPCVFWEVGIGGAEVEVDTETGQVTLHRLVVVGDAGRMINPELCRGADEGAAVMALGQTFFEHLVLAEDGSWANPDALTYRVPRMSDLPHEFSTIIQEQGHGPGPFGSKGFGEGGMLVVPSAVSNAIYDAVGVRITDLPITPAKVLAALERADEQS